MSRTHFVEETIKDQIPAGVLVEWLKANAYIPKDWERCSIEFKQNEVSAPLQFTAKSSYPKSAKP